MPLAFGAILEPVIGMVFLARWGAEQYARSWTAKNGVQGGVKITKNFESL